MSVLPEETIAAVATPPGKGGIGVVRISGPGVQGIAKAVIGRLPLPREALYCRFLDEADAVIDEGIALFFPRPRSFTGEDVLELQGHGGPVVLDMLLKRILSQGARIARPGEFSERAFHNGKMDLAQAEAVADLIESDTGVAARLAVRSLQGAFSRQVHDLVERLIRLRIYVEAAIDFPEEEIDFLSDGKVSTDLQDIIDTLDGVVENARIGSLLREGMQLVIAGRPNAGKSSLMNALAGRESAIVTEVPGTTRDVLRERIEIDGLPLHLVDTAGLRESLDRVEQEGVRRAKEQIAEADRILWMVDDRERSDGETMESWDFPQDVPLTVIRNKIDLTGRSPGVTKTAVGVEVALSVRTGKGLDLLQDHLKKSIGYGGSQEGQFIARRRHLEALDNASEHLLTGRKILASSASGELLAEDLRLAQQALSEITGAFCPDDLLGRIFSSFCIGK